RGASAGPGSAGGRGGMEAAQRVDILAEGLTTANFDGGIHKSRPEPRLFLSDVTVVTAAQSAVAGASAGRIVGDAKSPARGRVFSCPTSPLSLPPSPQLPPPAQGGSSVTPSTRRES